MLGSKGWERKQCQGCHWVCHICCESGFHVHTTPTSQRPAACHQASLSLVLQLQVLQVSSGGSGCFPRSQQSFRTTEGSNFNDYSVSYVWLSKGHSHGGPGHPSHFSLSDQRLVWQTLTAELLWAASWPAQGQAKPSLSPSNLLLQATRIREGSLGRWSTGCCFEKQAVLPMLLMERSSC